MDILEVFTNLSTWSVILFILGFLLVIVEMFNPGFGVPGALASSWESSSWPFWPSC
mgnify:CR=1 FL=1